MKSRTPLSVVSTCDDCGACCTEQGALPIHLVGDWIEDFRPVTPLPEDLKAELQATAARFLADGFPPDGSPCIWYDSATKRCKHYAHRPEMCRDEVKPGDEACLRWRRKLTRFRFVAGKLIQS